MSYMMYRETTLGVALSDTLNELVEESLISQALAAKVLSIFDKNINRALAHKVKNKMQFKSDRLVAYRYCDNVWTFIMKDIELRDVLWPVEQKVSK
ncbi:Transcription initiation factor IIA, gamma subunit, helical domain protein [Dictyocaulus viviparus]|uniref:Transcription initiation factor IIA subunit 2 n=1 Tax=Dictyocaulus viviparus TaxID=29172 RepID=A0A0D8Y291_DICVI|nr:Transcription initiation factor IIA, gamma subunit, helical domain protein [Dictyocaulus viviparus]